MTSEDKASEGTIPMEPAEEIETPSARVTIRTLIKGLIMIGSLVGIGYIARYFGLLETFDAKWLDQEVVGNGFLGEAIFVGVGTLITAVGAPRQIVAFGGGYAFGLFGGTVIALLAQGLGCAASFYYARLLGRKSLQKRFGARIRKVDAFLSGNTFTMTLMIRLLPVGSNIVTNLAAGVSGVRAVPFLLGSVVGYIPQTLIFALLGTGIAVDPVERIGLSVALFVVSGVLGVVLFQRLRRKS